MTPKIRTILVANLLTVFVGLTIAYVFGIDAVEARQKGISGIDEAYCYSLMTIVVAFITFFGLLELPGGRLEDGGFKAARIRFSITVTLIFVCLIYFATTGYWAPHERETEQLSEYAKEMIPVLKHLVIITLAFYFGATAATEILGRRNSDSPQPTQKSPSDDP